MPRKRVKKEVRIFTPDHDEAIKVLHKALGVAAQHISYVKCDSRYERFINDSVLQLLNRAMREAWRADLFKEANLGTPVNS